MKKQNKMLAAVLIIGILASTLMILPTAAAGGKNMIGNGKFTSSMSEWQSWTQDPSAASFEIVKEGPDGSRCLKITNKKPVATSVFQFVPCKPGRRYMMTCDVKYENVGTEGSGLCLGNTAYDSANNNIGETISASSFGSSADWRTISFVFEANQNMSTLNAGPRLWFSTGTVYVDNVTLVELKDTDAESGAYEVALSDTPNRHTVNALGCEWDPKMLLEVNREKGITEADLDLIKEKMEILGIQAVRMMITPDWFEKTNDNDDPKNADPAGFDFDNDEMKSVFAYLKVCEELGVRVTLTWWGAPAGHWLACENIGDWIGAPNDLDEMAENIAYLLGYIRGELKYTCVKELILQNEPSYSFKVDGGAVDFDYYVEYYKTVQKRLADDGMSDIVLVGADDSQHYGWYFKSYEGLKDVCGKFNSHNYAWSYDLPYLDILVQEFVSARTSISGDAPFYLGEFGDGSTAGAYVATSTDTYGRGLYVASVVVNALKAGAAGASYWPLHDIYYYDGDPNGPDNGGLMSMGLISYKKDGQWGFRPTYYAYGLLCNFIPFGSEVYDIKGDTDHYVDLVAVKTPEGKWSILAVNRSNAEQTVTVAAPAIDGVMKSYTYLDGKLPQDGTMIAATDALVTPTDGAYTLTLPAESFLVLSDMEVSEEDLKETETTAQETVSEESTEAPASGEPVAPDTIEPDSGCSSTISAAVALPAAVVAAGVVLKRKKKK